MSREELSALTLESLPVFPLPATVLFPGTALPLHIFEPRYVAMVEESLASNFAIAIAMLRDGADPLAPQAPIHEVACAGLIVHSERVQNDRFNIVVHGLDRVRLERELTAEQGYRRFAATRIDTKHTTDAGAELARLQSCVLSLRRSVEKTDAQLVEVLRSTSDPVELTDILSAVLVAEPAKRQTLLETESLRTRVSMLIDAVAEVMVRVGMPPAMAKMN